MRWTRRQHTHNPDGPMSTRRQANHSNRMPSPAKLATHHSSCLNVVSQWNTRSCPHHQRNKQFHIKVAVQAPSPLNPPTRITWNLNGMYCYGHEWRSQQQPRQQQQLRTDVSLKVIPSRLQRWRVGWTRWQFPWNGYDSRENINTCSGQRSRRLEGRQALSWSLQICVAW